MTAGALGRAIRRATVPRGRSEPGCELCAAGLPEVHRHVLDTGPGELMCVCQACALLFDQEAASEGHYRLVPRRRLRLGEVPTKGLGVPVGLAYFVPRADGAVVAHYPSPAGPTRWEVDPSAWRELVDRHPELDTIAADVEALLVNTNRGQRHHWLVPVDDCFRLVALVRREWHGISGGSRVWPEIDRFFAELTEQRR